MWVFQFLDPLTGMELGLVIRKIQNKKRFKMNKDFRVKIKWLHDQKPSRNTEIKEIP